MRIRTIKPDFFLDEELSELEPLARIAFQGLWCAADRRGRLEDRPKRLKVEILPYDNCDFDALLSALHNAGFIIRYEAEGKRIIQVVNFEKHQRITGKEAEAESHFPEYSGETLVKQQGNTRETTETTGREGKGIGKEGNTPLPPKGADPRVAEIVSYLNAKAGREFDPGSKWHELNARLKDGATVDECKLVIDFKTDEWGKCDLAKNINPTTLFRPNNWIRYLPDAKIWSKNGHSLGAPQKSMQEELEENMTAIGLVVDNVRN